ncbi:ATP-binding protein [Chloroflexi bacterium CFX3]|nr:ATP-binding protein [Chloroflexi bacterium CFX3]
MLPLSAIVCKPPRPAGRVHGAWHTNPYQRNSALDLAKRLVRATVPHGSESWSSQWVAKALKNTCGAPDADLQDLPARFESRQAFFAAALGKGWQIDDDRMTDNPAPKRRFALKVLSIIADLPPHHFSSFRMSHKNALHSATSRALHRWTGIDVRGLDEGLFMTPEDARTLWEACVKAAVWQRAVNAAKKPDAAPITPDLLNAFSVAEMLEAAEAWRLSQPSPIERNMDMSQINDSGYEEVPDANSTLDALRQSTAALGVEDEDEDTGEFDPPPGMPKELAERLKAAKSEGEATSIIADYEAEKEAAKLRDDQAFLTRLQKMLRDAGITEAFKIIFKRATGFSGLTEARNEAGLTNTEIEQLLKDEIASQKKAQSAPEHKAPAEPKGSSERLPAPKSGQSAQSHAQGDRNPFAPASASGTFIRMALFGPSGSGKSYTALNIACNIKPDARVAVIDTERGSARLYAKQFKFDVVELSDYSPRNYIDLLLAAERHGYDVVVVDSLSHAWMGTGGVLDMVDKARAKSTSGNSFTAWKDATPMQNKLVDAILGVRCHVIATLRVKTEWVLETNERGKQVPRKVGLAPVQREGIEYEFGICGEIDADHRLVFTKSRCPQLADAVFPKAGGEVATILRDWLEIE